MKWKIDTSHLPMCLKVSAIGPFSELRYIEMWTEVLASKYWHRGLSVIVDGRMVMSWNGNEGSGPLKTLASFFEANAEKIGPSLIARVVDQPGFQRARSLQYALRLRDLPMKLKVFLDEEEALNWIVSKSTNV